MKKIIISAALVVSVFISSFVQTYAAIDPISAIGLGLTAAQVLQTYLDKAASAAEKEAALSGYQDHWISTLDGAGGYADVSYDALSSALVELSNSAQPSKIVYSSTAGGYVIQASGPFGYHSYSDGNGFGATHIWNNTGWYLTNTQRVVFRAQYNTDSLLSSIDSNITSFGITISNKLTSVGDSLLSLNQNLSRLVGFFDGQMSGLNYWIYNIAHSAAVIEGAALQFNEFRDGKTVTDIISAISSAADKTDILAALTNIENNTAEFNTKLGNLNITSSFDDSAILTALEPVTSFFSGHVRTTEELTCTNGRLVSTLKYQQGTLSLIDITAPADSDVFFRGRFTLYCLSSNIIFDSSLCSRSYMIPTAPGHKMEVNSDHISVTVKGRDERCSVPAGTYDIFFFDEAGSPLALYAGDNFLPSSELGTWVIRRASDGSEIRIGSTTGLPDGYAFSDLFYPIVRFKASDITSSPALFSYWMDYFYDSSLGKSGFTVLASSTDISMSVSYETLHPLLGWFAQQQNGFQSWLDSKLDSLSFPAGGSSSDLTTLESTAASIESTLSIINDKLDNTATKIENTTVNITNDNSAYNVFYVTDEDGNEHSITSVAGDSLSAGGKLLNFLYKLVVDGALSGVDGAVDGLGDFFFDSSPSGLGEGVSVWD